MTGRPKALRPLEDQVEFMARRGNTAEDIAEILGLSRRGIYRRKLQTAMARGRAMLRQNLRTAQIKAALVDRNPQILVFLGKQLLGQKDNPIEIHHQVTAVPDAELRQQLLDRLTKIRELSTSGDGSVGGGTVPRLLEVASDDTSIEDPASDGDLG